MITQTNGGSRRAALGFTLIELLVTLAIIAILAGLSLGGLATARFRSRVTVCANNFRQWGIAVNLYAQEDTQGRLPAFSLPLELFAAKRYDDLYPWLVSLQMGTNMARHGVTVPMWFCPAKRGGISFRNTQNHFESMGRVGKLSTVEDLTEVWRSQFTFFAGIDYCWWVPRPLDGSTEVYPDPKLSKCRLQVGWPTRLEAASGAIQPILTDWAIGYWNEGGTAIEISGGNGGHEFPPFMTTRSLNALFVDGHVETRLRKKLDWQLQLGRGAVMLY